MTVDYVIGAFPEKPPELPRKAKKCSRARSARDEVKPAAVPFQVGRIGASAELVGADITLVAVPRQTDQGVPEPRLNATPVKGAGNVEYLQDPGGLRAGIHRRRLDL
jgi:hypothetical protein